MVKDIRIKVSLTPFYLSIYEKLNRKGFFSNYLSRNFFFCFFCNLHLRRKGVSKFLYRLFKEQFLPREIEIGKKEIKSCLYIIENETIFLFVKKNLELLLFENLKRHPKDFEKIKLTLQGESILKRNLRLQTNGLTFLTRASLIRFILLAINESLKNNKV